MAWKNNRIDNRQLAICFRIHQPKRLGKEEGEITFDDASDRAIMERVAEECYIPTNTLLLRLIEQYPDIKISFSISGTTLEQMEQYAPDALDSFRKLAATGAVDFLSEPYYHSLAFLMESDEFEIQILEHAEKLVELLGVHPSVFSNAGLFYNDDIGRRIAMMGFNGVLTEGTERSLRNNVPHNLYEHKDQNGLKILFRNPRLSDDIAFRVASPEWNISASDFYNWLDAMPDHEKLVTIALDYETFGVHHKVESGIFTFLESLLLLVVMQKNYRMATMSEIAQFSAERPVSIPDHVSVEGCGLTDLLGNDFQREAFSALIALENQLKAKNDQSLLKFWRYLQSCDHFFCMNERMYHTAASSFYQSAQEAFDTYMRFIQHLNDAIFRASDQSETEKLNEAVEAERRNIHAPSWALNLEVNHGTGIREHDTLKNS